MRKRKKASRHNALQSTGPKETVSTRLNATLHGILSKEVIIRGPEGSEDVEAFEALRGGLFRQLSPVGEMEQLLTDQIVMAVWRWRRVLRFEAGAIKQQMGKVDLTVTERLSDADRFHRYLQESATEEELRAHLPLVESHEDWPNDLRGRLVDEFLRFVQLMYKDALGREGLGRIERVEIVGYSAETDDSREVMITLERVQKMYGMTLEEVREVYIQWLKVNIESRTKVKKSLAVYTEQQMLMASLPTDAEIAKIQRYESHLSGQYYKAMHELERLQASRLWGQPQPPVAMDVHVSGG